MRRSIWMFMLVSSIAAVAAAQEPQAAGEAVGPQDFREWYWYSPAMRDARGFDRRVPLDFPADELREYAYSRARVMVAHYEMMASRDRLNEHIARMKRQFEASPEFAAARQDEETAWAEYQAAVSSVSARLLNDPVYQAHLSLTAELRGQIRDTAEVTSVGGSARGAAVSPAVLELAENKLEYARRASAMRAEAMAMDPGVTEARLKLMSAASRVGEMRLAFQNAVRDDAVVLQLREELDRARIADLAAAAYAKASRIIANESMKYARRLSRHGRQSFYSRGFFDYAPQPFAYDVVNTGDRSGYRFRRR